MNRFRPASTVILLLGMLSGIPTVLAQESTLLEPPGGVAEYVPIPDQANIVNGSIIALVDGVYQLASEPYTSTLFGVYVEQPAVAVSQVGRTGAYPVSTSGTVAVRVTAQNGPITAGDRITSSTTPGVGMLATNAGYVLGTALASHTAAEEGIIPVTIDVEFVTVLDQASQASRSLLSQARDVATVGLRAAASEPNTTLRYLLAAIVLITSSVLGFFLFGRAATNGLIAVGRNPLARRSIFAMMILNISLTLGFAIIGLVLAIVILAL